ncbi:MAG: exodeoxyribonuclease VII large subunit [Lysobacteraceae bacterium]
MTGDIRPGAGAGERQVLTPAQLNALARDLLEGSFPSIWIEGEVSNLSRPASGHLYFTLKDDRAQVRCALFRSRAGRLAFQPANGQQVQARGRLTLYEPRGDYQLVLETLEDAGAGALRAAFEALRARLDAEGLFDRSARPALPRFVRRLALVTSPNGAAVRDVLAVLGRRFPLVEVEVVPVPVQGASAPPAIIDALAAVVRAGRHDAVLLTRGGGSLEDLWAFNEEALVRAVAASPVPVVVAVGHEIDVSLAEFAATLRGPTPSAAAELLVPERGQVLAGLQLQHRQLARSLQRRLETCRQRLDQAGLRLESRGPLARLERGRHRLDALAARLPRGGALGVGLAARRLERTRMRLQPHHPGAQLSRQRERLAQALRRMRELTMASLQQRRHAMDSSARALHALGPLPTLERGYAVLREPDGGAVLRSVAQARVGQQVDARLADGSLRLQVLDVDGSGSG